MLLLCYSQREANSTSATLLTGSVLHHTLRSTPNPRIVSSMCAWRLRTISTQKSLSTRTRSFHSINSLQTSQRVKNLTSQVRVSRPHGEMCTASFYLRGGWVRAKGSHPSTSDWILMHATQAPTEDAVSEWLSWVAQTYQMCAFINLAA